MRQNSQTDRLTNTHTMRSSIAIVCTSCICCGLTIQLIRFYSTMTYPGLHLPFVVCAFVTLQKRLLTYLLIHVMFVKKQSLRLSFCLFCVIELASILWHCRNYLFSISHIKHTNCIIWHTATDRSYSMGVSLSRDMAVLCING